LKSATRDRKLSSSIKKRINADVDTTAIDKEIKTYKTQMRKLYGRKDVINNDIEALDVEDKHYLRRKRDLEDGLYKIYARIDEVESLILEAQSKRQSILEEKTSADNIYKLLVFFDKICDFMTEEERRLFVTQLIDEINVYEERQSNGQWIKSIKFKVPMICNETVFGLDKNNCFETVALLSKLHEVKHHVNVK